MIWGWLKNGIKQNELTIRLFDIYIQTGFGIK